LGSENQHRKKRFVGRGFSRDINAEIKTGL